MLKSIELSFEDIQNLFLVCSNCSNRIIPLQQATSFVKNTQQINTYYFLSQYKSQQNQYAFQVDLFSFIIEVKVPFQLMELGKVYCRYCQEHIGIMVKSSSEEETRWMSNCILFFNHKLDFNKQQVRKQLLGTLIDQINYLDQGHLNQKNTQIEEKQQRLVDEEDYQGIVKQSLSNIILFSQAINQISSRVQNLIAYRKYQNVKIRSQKKKNIKRQ